MTYCVGLLLDAGMVFLSDTRTNAGVDNIATYRKLFTFVEPGERVIVLQTAGSLSITQTVLAKLSEAIEDSDNAPYGSIMHAPSMLRVAEIVGQVLSDVTADISTKVNRMNQAASASMIVGGQRAGGAPRMFLLYPEGNFIEATRDTPFLQIGEHKYGKPILDRVVNYQTPLARAYQCALISFDSTMKSNLSVGMPLDVAIYRKDALTPCLTERVEENCEYFRTLRQQWHQGIQDLFVGLQPPMLSQPDYSPPYPVSSI